VDGSRGASRYLDAQVGPPDMVASDEQAELVTTLRQIRKALDVFELDDKKLVNALKASMAGAEALRGPGFRITWKPTKERTTTDWKAVAAVYRDELLSLQRAVMGDTSEAVTAYDAIEAQHTTTGEGTRPFRVNFEEGEGS
jgi:predicted phage-related endonuclease